MKVLIINHSQKNQDPIRMPDTLIQNVPLTGDYLDFRQSFLLPPAKEGYKVIARSFHYNFGNELTTVTLFIEKA